MQVNANNVRLRQLGEQLGMTFLLLSFLVIFTPHVFCKTCIIDSSSFFFPLDTGDTWIYEISNDVFPGEHWSYQDTITVESDTLMPNGKKYFKLPAMWSNETWPIDDKQFFRKDGLKVYQFFPKDSVEYLRFDFSAQIGDTISSISFDPFSGIPSSFPTNIVLYDIKRSQYLGAYEKTFNFTGMIPGSGNDGSFVADSLGIVQQRDDYLSWWSLIGARINGKAYGTMLFVHDRSDRAPDRLHLYQNYPNPFNPSSTIEYSVPQKSFVTLKLYDLLGREVRTLVNSEQEAGNYSRIVDANDLPSGMYFYRLQAGNQIETEKLLLLK